LFLALPYLNALSSSRRSRASNARRSSRQERSDRVSEEASFHRYLHVALTPGSHIFHLPHVALS
ncbi:TPA: hypothetical protein ACRT7T_002698, partial [Staphylococcus aureus]